MVADGALIPHRAVAITSLPTTLMPNKTTSELFNATEKSKTCRKLWHPLECLEPGLSPGGNSSRQEAHTSQRSGASC